MRAELLGEEVKSRKGAIVFDVVQLDGREGRVVRRAWYAVGVRKCTTADTLRVIDGDRYRLLAFPLAV